jgi:hypothetical protein
MTPFGSPRNSNAIFKTFTANSVLGEYDIDQPIDCLRLSLIQRLDTPNDYRPYVIDIPTQNLIRTQYIKLFQ